MQQTRAAPPATLDVVLERITYANEETGYTVAWVATDRSGDLLMMVGPLLGAQPGRERTPGSGSTLPRDRLTGWPPLKTAALSGR
jgi:exodeoxyribonuclease V alpha subunit